MSAKFGIRRGSAGDYNVAVRSRNSKFVLKALANKPGTTCNENTLSWKQILTAVRNFRLSSVRLVATLLDTVGAA